MYCETLFQEFRHDVLGLFKSSLIPEDHVELDAWIILLQRTSRFLNDCYIEVSVILPMVTIIEEVRNHLLDFLHDTGLSNDSIQTVERIRPIHQISGAIIITDVQRPPLRIRHPFKSRACHVGYKSEIDGIPWLAIDHLGHHPSLQGRCHLMSTIIVVAKIINTISRMLCLCDQVWHSLAVQNTLTKRRRAPEKQNALLGEDRRIWGRHPQTIAVYRIRELEHEPVFEICLHCELTTRRRDVLQHRMLCIPCGEFAPLVVDVHAERPGLTQSRIGLHRDEANHYHDRSSYQQASATTGTTEATFHRLSLQLRPSRATRTSSPEGPGVRRFRDGVVMVPVRSSGRGGAQGAATAATRSSRID